MTSVKPTYDSQRARWLRHIEFFYGLYFLIYVLETLTPKIRRWSLLPGLPLLWIHIYVKNIDFRMPIFLWVIRFFYYGIILLDLSYSLLNRKATIILVKAVVTFCAMVLVEVCDHRSRWITFKKQTDEEVDLEQFYSERQTHEATFENNMD
ncbi:hypothetical protein HG535_0B03910 [Zygotorulaspora mrakii]|uniref:Uncharacterized protein n=1 Tax=Zygotorulaspora mrakii TaxID=42260 RepID=A0A7H9AYF4_ZYGMR|nr:uncharacterized protein HG535_0B03910 [Zygotorulaspora mrakii]QLG71351.1 hypothetical protein HG535_0B03910 [Zygotorulaspora mrakii]